MVEISWQKHEPNDIPLHTQEQEPALIIAGLTGGIASGKSTVAAFLAEAGAIIIDADQIAREVVAPGLPAWKEICDHFGQGILDAQNQIDRERLGRIVFDNADARHTLERIVHPKVGHQIDTRLEQIARTAPDSVVIMDIPLLFETGRTEGLSEIIVVHIPENLQKQRLMKRNGLNAQEAQARMASQMPLSEKAKKATIVIDNSGSIEQTRQQTLDVYRQLVGKAEMAIWDS